MRKFASIFKYDEIFDQPGRLIPWRTIVTVIIPIYKILKELPEYLEKKLNEVE